MFNKLDYFRIIIYFKNCTNLTIIEQNEMYSISFIYLKQKYLVFNIVILIR